MGILIGHGGSERNPEKTVFSFLNQGRIERVFRVDDRCTVRIHCQGTAGRRAAGQLEKRIGSIRLIFNHKDIEESSSF